MTSGFDEVMRKVLLAIDVGGSTTRAYLVDPEGNCLGQGRSRGGNPASNTPELAASAMIAAVEAAVADAGGGPFDIVIAQIALAGPQVHVAVARLEAAFRSLGMTGEIVFAGDLLAMFASATPATEGYCVVCGTGAGCIRIRGGEINRVVDLAGWQLGDLGSGYWLGHEAAKAAVAEMEGRGPATALTPAVLQNMGIPSGGDGVQGRPMELRLFIDGIYALRPIELARFAPLVVAQRGDAVADSLVAQAERYLATDFATAFDPTLPGPVVLGGGVIAHLTGLPGAIGDVIRGSGATPDIRFVTDGSAGAIVLALRATGVVVDAAMLERIAASVAAKSAKAST